MNKKKTIIFALVLALVLVVGGMLAYFTAEESKTNTFTIGNIKIKLEELNWKPEDAQNLMPNAEVAKDPKITNTSTTNNDAYVFATVEIPYYNNKQLFTYTPNSGWTQVGNAKIVGNTITYTYAWGSATEMTKLAKGASTGTIFDKVKLDELSNETMTAIGDKTSFDVVVHAYGIQADNLDVTTPAEIFALFN